MVTRKGLADEIDQIDEAIKAYNDSKRDAFDAYRDQLIAAGVAKANVKTEIEAVKAAIRRRRAVRKNESAELEKSELIDEVFEEITAVTRAPRAHVENIEEFDAETGEILDEKEETHQRPSTNDEPSPEAGPQAEASPAGTGTGTLADREGRFDGEAASVDLPTNQPETAIDPPAFLTKTPSPLRPHCQRPEMCAGVGRNHCGACTKAMREQEELA